MWGPPISKRRSWPPCTKNKPAGVQPALDLRDIVGQLNGCGRLGKQLAVFYDGRGIGKDIKTVDSIELADIALDVSKFLKAIANPDRLQILCLLVQQEMNVTALEHATGISQPRLSQHLARLRKEGLVKDRRQAKEKLYSLSSVEAQEVITLLHGLFCALKTS